MTQIGTRKVHTGKQCPNRQVVSFQLQTRSVKGWDSVHKARSAQTDNQCQFSHRQEVSQAGTSSVHKQGKKCPNRQVVSIQLQTSSVKGWDEQRPQTRQDSAQTYKQCQFSHRQEVSQAGTRSVHKQGKKCPNRQVVSIQLQTSSVKGWDEQHPQTRQEVPKQTSSVNSATDKKCQRLRRAVSTKQGKKCPNRQAVSIQLQTSSVKSWDEQRPQTRQEVPKTDK